MGLREDPDSCGKCGPFNCEFVSLRLLRNQLCSKLAHSFKLGVLVWKGIYIRQILVDQLASGVS